MNRRGQRGVKGLELGLAFEVFSITVREVYSCFINPTVSYSVPIQGVIKQLT